MRTPPVFAPVYLVSALILACLSGCFHGSEDSDPEPVPALKAEARMELVENQVNRDSLVDIFLGVRISHSVPGRTYLVTADVEFVGQNGSKAFRDVQTAQDSTFEVSWRFTEEIKGLRGVTLRAALKVDSVELARDSVTYY